MQVFPGFDPFYCYVLLLSHEHLPIEPTTFFIPDYHHHHPSDIHHLSTSLTAIIVIVTVIVIVMQQSCTCPCSYRFRFRFAVIQAMLCFRYVVLLLIECIMDYVSCSVVCIAVIMINDQ